jgi:hypothetical protein
VRVLLDECLPRQLKPLLPGLTVQTVPECGWAGVQNGELLARAVGQFEVFLTVDRNLPYQQNLEAFPIAVVALRAFSNDIDDLRPLVPELVARLPGLQPGTITVIGA